MKVKDLMDKDKEELARMVVQYWKNNRQLRGDKRVYKAKISELSKKVDTFEETKQRVIEAMDILTW